MCTSWILACAAFLVFSPCNTVQKHLSFLPHPFLFMFHLGVYSVSVWRNTRRKLEISVAKSQVTNASQKPTETTSSPDLTCLNNISLNEIRSLEQWNRIYYGNHFKLWTGRSWHFVLLLIPSFRTFRLCHVKWCVGLYSQMQKYVLFHHTHKFQNSMLKAGMSKNHSTSEKHG